MPEECPQFGVKCVFETNSPPPIHAAGFAGKTANPAVYFVTQVLWSENAQLKLAATDLDLHRLQACATSVFVSLPHHPQRA